MKIISKQLSVFILGCRTRNHFHFLHSMTGITGYRDKSKNPEKIIIKKIIIYQFDICDIGTLMIV